MVSHHQTTPIAAQRVKIVNAIVQYAEAARHGQEEAEAGRNAATRQAATAGAVALDEQQQVEPDQRQQQPAHAKQREAEAGHHQTP